MTEVVRQGRMSGVLYNATWLRRAMKQKELPQPRLFVKRFDDVIVVPGEELEDSISASYNEYGEGETLIVTRTNKRAVLFNLAIRSKILYKEEELCRDERLMVAKNNYLWSAKVKGLDFVANGDIAIVERIYGTESRYGFRFADVSLFFPDYECEMDVKILLDTLTSESPSLTKAENERLFAAVWDDYAEIRAKRKRMEKLREDPYYNAMQVKYGYAVTCHKAQGGQWRTVFLDQGYTPPEGVNNDYFRWLYTAFTRATERLYLVNWPQQCVE